MYIMNVKDHVMEGWEYIDLLVACMKDERGEKRSLNIMGVFLQAHVSSYGNPSRKHAVQNRNTAC